MTYSIRNPAKERGRESSLRADTWAGYDGTRSMRNVIKRAITVLIVNAFKCSLQSDGHKFSSMGNDFYLAVINISC